MKRAREIKGSDFGPEVLHATHPVLVAFMTSWSRPCQVFEATLNEVAAECDPDVEVVRINADDQPDISFWYDIQSIPTLLYILAGRVRDRVVGTTTKEAILSKLKTIQGEAPVEAADRRGRNRETKRT